MEPYLTQEIFDKEQAESDAFYEMELFGFPAAIAAKNTGIEGMLKKDSAKLREAGTMYEELDLPLTAQRFYVKADRIDTFHNNAKSMLAKLSAEYAEAREFMGDKLNPLGLKIIKK